ncbi:hypothetical protein [Virgibacillus indicus]
MHLLLAGMGFLKVRHQLLWKRSHLTGK